MVEEMYIFQLAQPEKNGISKSTALWRTNSKLLSSVVFLFFFVQPKVMALDDGDTFYCCDMSITFGEKERVQSMP